MKHYFYSFILCIFLLPHYDHAMLGHNIFKNPIYPHHPLNIIDAVEKDDIDTVTTFLDTDPHNIEATEEPFKKTICMHAVWFQAIHQKESKVLKEILKRG